VTKALLALLLCLFAVPARAADTRYNLTAQGKALAPNAGGQDAYALRLGTNNWEVAGFVNQYITAGGVPLIGGTFDFRLPVCDDSCFWQFFAQAGGGISTGGPLAEITWGTQIPLLPLWLPTRAPPYVPQLRIDFTSQFIFIRYRAVTWSYPLWAGISIPF
jgi:hypothetical protein